LYNQLGIVILSRAGARTSTAQWSWSWSNQYDQQPL
jgi:hypothetical protein